MEVSSIKLTAETKARLQNPTLDRAKRQQLRRQLVVEYIQSKPIGSIFTTSEINKTAWPPGHPRSNVLKFIKAMERDGLIAIEPIPNSYKYRLSVENARTVKPKQTVFKPLWKDQESAQPQGFENVEQLARDFAWETNSDSLREFIKWCKVQTFDKLTKDKT